MLLNILLGGILLLGVSLVWMSLDSEPDPNDAPDEDWEIQAARDAYRWN